MDGQISIDTTTRILTSLSVLQNDIKHISTQLDELKALPAQIHANAAAQDKTNARIDDLVLKCREMTTKVETLELSAEKAERMYDWSIWAIRIVVGLFLLGLMSGFVWVVQQGGWTP